eukprot:CAMPEP_0206551776 /NCGR_PEP_ID=MMETSP0325_2-20121206/15713_1 /ASSEMBLY_ACC=CAM_ASM_000347 /TAXON_ID=2866 /ORGANISM="Crypthecodinium cohnii, Strain Seligo" /LENGTH=77 /DNA_ID=CAMNT_0054051577 /DNA_START=131 /DNA_END=364 /DNA_ORIENTATION=-
MNANEATGAFFTNLIIAAVVVPTILAIVTYGPQSKGISGLLDTIKNALLAPPPKPAGSSPGGAAPRPAASRQAKRTD